MSKRRTGDPWMPAPEYGRSLTGLTVNLLVPEIEPALVFHTDVLDAQVIYADPDIAVLSHQSAQWMLHAHHTYDGHPFHGALTAPRGAPGPELRLHGRDPDAAEAAARSLGFRVVQPTADKPHGLRECFVLDAQGHLWVPDVPSRD